MALVFTYRGLQQNNYASLTKGGLDTPSFGVDWSQGVPGGVTLSTTTITAVDEDNQSTTNVVNTSSNSGTTTTVVLKTGGASGTGAAVDGARFRIRLLQALSNSQTLLFDVFLIISNPTYGPVE